MASPSSLSPSGLPSSSSGATTSLPGLTDPGETSEPLASTQTLSNDPLAVGSVEAAITVSTLHDILARILEQTNALWERQESTNRMLDELRQSISAPQAHHTEFDERLRRMESLTETLVKQTTGNGHGVQESVKESSHSSTHYDVGHTGPSDEQLLGTLRPQVHVTSNSDVLDQPGAVSSTMPAQPGISVLSSYDQHPEPGPLGTSQGTEGHDTERNVVPVPSPTSVQVEQSDAPPEAHIRDEGHEVPITATFVDNSRLWGDTRSEQMRPTAQTAEVEWSVALRNQLTDVTNLVQRNADLCQKKNDLMEQYLAERRHGEEGRDRQIHEMMGMTYWLVKEAEEARRRDERIQAANDVAQAVADVLRGENKQQREFMIALSDDMRTDSSRQHQEIISAVRATASEQIPFNVEAYLDEFSKALSVEVRMLLGEVGKLREERRAIQHEIGYLLTIKSSHGPGGEFAPEWMLPSESSTDSSPDGTPSSDDLPLPEIRRPRSAWRLISLRGVRRSLAPEPIPLPAARAIPSWATWQPDPTLVPSPSAEPPFIVPEPESPGLFGPPSPRSSYRV